MAVALTACQGGGASQPAPSGGEAAAATTAAPEAAARTTVATGDGGLQPLTVSDNQRYLVHEDGTPFVYQGDTAWALIARGSREDVVTYLDARQAQGYNVIQTVAVFPISGAITENAYGHAPIDGDVTRRDEDYWRHADFVIEEVEKRGMHVALLPIWMSGSVDSGFIDPSNAVAYGRFVGERYRDHEAVIWVMGGDSRQYDPEVDRAIARGVTEGVTGSQDHSRVLMTYHPGTPQTSSTAYHDEEWLDFNMTQTSHCGVFPSFIRQEYALEPPKPVIDSESIYEDHPICWEVERGYSTPEQVRGGWYASTFGGAFGFVYGNQATWQMYAPEHEPIVGPKGYWYDMLDREAAADAVHLRRLLESRPVLSRVPDQAMITSTTGTGDTFASATRAEDGSYAFVYTSLGDVTVSLAEISGETVQLWWYDPRSGKATDAGQAGAFGTRTFTPPDDQDWVLVLDDAARGFPPPGT